MNSDDAKVHLARKVEKMWLERVATGDGEADGLGPVVDALYYGNPEEAIARCRDGNVAESLADEIRAIYGL